MLPSSLFDLSTLYPRDFMIILLKKQEMTDRGSRNFPTKSLTAPKLGITLTKIFLKASL